MKASGGVAVDGAQRRRLPAVAISILLATGCGVSSNPPASGKAGKTESTGASRRPGYFPSSYEDARVAFVASRVKLAEIFGADRLENGSIPVPIDTRRDYEGGLEADDLSVDWTYIPAPGEKRGLLVIASGVHGIEAFASSAVQQLLIQELLAPLATAGKLNDVGILFVHGINPWGYRHRRRVTEHNVDLNRHFFVTDAERNPEPPNPPNYGTLADDLQPGEPVGKLATHRATILAEIVPEWLVRFKGDQKEMMQAILGGQYDYPDGLYYGGNAFEPQKAPLEQLLSSKAAPYQAVFLMDIHTGYGERGKLHLFGHQGNGSQGANAQIFAGFQVDTGDDEDFYETHGDFTIYLGQLLPDNKVYIGMTMEFGTLDSHTFSGSIESLLRTKLENQGWHYGYDSPSLQDEVLNEFREMYYPSDPDWRTKIMDQSVATFPLLIERFGALRAQ